jgi:serine/threonine protein kinase
MAELIGRTLGDYRIEAHLGRGATGEVYRGAHRNRTHPAAIKVLSPSLSGDPGFPPRFRASMRPVLELRHPHIVEAHDAGVDGGLCYIAMEFVTGGSLRALLRRRPPGEPLPLPLAVELAGQAAMGLAHAHARGLIHKDIRPSNLLLDADPAPPERGEERHVLKITDFGLAHLATAGSELTTSGVALGTGVMLGVPAYMSPEHCTGRRLDERSDLYSLGVVLYDMCTGYLPFQVRGLYDALRTHVFTPPPLPRQLNPALPPELERVLLRCLAKKPEDRYETADELAYALRMTAPVG